MTTRIAPPHGYDYCRRCWRLVKEQNLRGGFGPGCWRRVTHGNKFIPWLKGAQRTVTDSKRAERSMVALWEQFTNAIDLKLCTCGGGYVSAPITAILASYDHSNGIELPGFGKRQYVFLYCPKCGFYCTWDKLTTRSDLAGKES
ncbi:MAG: hypothetical protein ACXV2D_06220 [Halobacteriota archaeon]